MRIYNVLGFAILAMQLLISAILAPPWLGPYWGMVVGFAYLLASWFSGGLYLSDMIHLGIAHRALDYKDWFIKTVTLVNNAFFVYVDPVSWVNRHRLHHKFSDHAGDPNKLASDGFWRTLYRCLLPYTCTDNMANDAILKTWPFRLVSHPLFVVVAEDNAMNIGDWLPVMATFSACWQNNHHRYPHLLRTTHAPAEFDFGYSTVRVMNALGLVKASKTGVHRPNDLALAQVTL